MPSRYSESDSNSDSDSSKEVSSDSDSESEQVSEQEQARRRMVVFMWQMYHNSAIQAFDDPADKVERILTQFPHTYDEACTPGAAD